MATTSASEYVWNRWVTSSTTSTTAIDGTADRIWTNWNQTYTTTASVNDTNDTVWINWNRDYNTQQQVLQVTYNDRVWQTWVSDSVIQDAKNLEEVRDFYQKTIDDGIKRIKRIKPPTAEQTRANKAQIQIRKEWNELTYKEREREHKEAEKIALELLFELLSEEEIARYEKTKRLYISGKDKYDYVLSASGVYKVKKSKVVSFAKAKKAKGKFICAHPKNSTAYPSIDNLITLKLWIENHEKEFLKIGNHHPNESTILEFDKVSGL